MLRRLALPSGLLLAAALVGAHGPAGCHGDDGCGACEAPKATGTLADSELKETSGIATSATHDGVFYAHNDAGDTSRFFAFSRDGADLGIYKVKGADNVDWEDMAQGPCDAGSCVYLGDIGDNTGVRIAYTLYRVPEPTTIGPGEQSLPGDRIVFTYPNGANDAETLLVHPTSGVVTIITKTSGAATIFELVPPLTTGLTAMAREAGEVEPPDGGKFTGGAIHPDGTAIVLRTTKGLLRYPMTPDQSAADALAGAPCSLPAVAETNGEAVTWLQGGAGIMTIGEGAGAQIHVAACDG